MSLTFQVGVGALVVYLLILLIRWFRVRPLSMLASQRAALAAFAFSGAVIGGAYPLLWAMGRHIGLFVEKGSATFTFAGNLPYGVNEDDLLVSFLVGMIVLVGLAVAEFYRACQ